MFNLSISITSVRYRRERIFGNESLADTLEMRTLKGCHLFSFIDFKTLVTDVVYVHKEF